MTLLARIRPEVRPFSRAIQDGISNRIRRALSGCRYRELRAIEVESMETNPVASNEAPPTAEPGVRVRIRGNVSSFFMKQMAQELIRQVAPDVGIRNDLQVIPKGRVPFFSAEHYGDSNRKPHFRPKG